jgi:hypothetical protein
VKCKTTITRNPSVTVKTFPLMKFGFYMFFTNDGLQQCRINFGPLKFLVFFLPRYAIFGIVGKINFS